MSMIRRYKQWPAMFVPDVGEVVLAARSPAGPFLRAVVLYTDRRAEDFIRVGFEWLENYPLTPKGKEVVAGTTGNVYVRRDDRIPLIRRVPARR